MNSCCSVNYANELAAQEMDGEGLLLINGHKDGDPFISYRSLFEKPGSNPFRYLGDTLDTAALKAGHEIMKENQNRSLCDLKSSEKDVDLPPLTIKDENGLWKSLVHDCSISNNDLSTGEVNEVQIPDASHAIPSRQRGLLEKDSNVYTDKSVTECELPEPIVCYREPTCHVVKDICIDEGVPSQENIVVEDNKGEHVSFHDFQIPDNDKISELSKEKVGNVITIPDGEKVLEVKDYNKEDGDYKEFIHTSEASIDGKNKTADDIAKEKVMPENMLTVGEVGTENSFSELFDFDGSKIERQPLLTPCEAVISHISAPKESKDSGTIGKLSAERKAENGGIAFHLDSSAPVGSSRGKSPVNCEAENMSWPENGKLHDDGSTVSCQLQNGPGDTSFSVVGPSSGVITYSGPITHSGSLSRRSDSSATSTHSFAFPILQSEWNSSPVRMAKADGKRFRKQKSGKRGLFCCRF